jgi:trehalose synthase-fused probable maltokinase
VSAPLPVLGASTFEQAFDGAQRVALEHTALPGFLRRQRWFAAKGRPIRQVRIVDSGPLLPPLTPFVTIADVEYEDGAHDRYALPLTVTAGEAGAALLAARPLAAIAWIARPGGRLLVDALADDTACRGLLASLQAGREFPLQDGSVVSLRDAPAPGDEAIATVPVKRTGAEQSNSSVIFGTRAILKIYRRIEAGPHPELELGRYLRAAGFDDVPAVLGSMEYRRDGESCALAVLHALVPDAVDGWEHGKAETADYYLRVAGRPGEEAESLAPAGRLLDAAKAPLAVPVLRAVGDYLGAARTLGEQTATLHRTLARGAGQALEPEPLTHDDLVRTARSVRGRGRTAFTQLAERVPSLDAHAASRAQALLDRERALLDRLDRIEAARLDVTRTRCHQDYHLGQLLWTGSRYVLLDFEGEPARSLAERRAKRSPLADVAGMVRSYSYAAWSGLFAWSKATGGDARAHEPWALLWESAVSSTFLSAYLGGTRDESFIPSDDDAFDGLLGLLMLDKALYELQYELNNRPDWLLVPVEGLITLAE